MATANYAYIKNGEVVNIAVFEESVDEQTIELFKTELFLDEIVKSNNKVGIGGTYDGSKFWHQQPYPSWIKDEDLNEWVAPVSKPEFDPENPLIYIWNEEILNWEQVSE